MRILVILFALTIFFGGVSFYLLNTLNPFDETNLQTLIESEKISERSELIDVVSELADRGLLLEYLNGRNLLVIALTVALTIISAVTLVHVIGDRIFFSKFYQKPKYAVAARRAVLVVVAIYSLIIYRLVAAEWYLIVLTLVLIVIIEMMITRLTQPLPAEQDPADTSETATSDWQKYKLRWQALVQNVRSFRLPKRKRPAQISDIEASQEPGSVPE